MEYLYILFFYIRQILHSLFARMVMISDFKKLYILPQKEKGL